MAELTKGQLLRQSDGVEMAPLQQDAILFNPKSNRFCILNKTSSFIWSRLKSPASPEQIAEELCMNFSGVAPADALNDVQNALTTFLDLELVIPAS